MWQDDENIEPLYLLYLYKSTDTDTKPSRKATEHMWQDEENLEPLALPSPALHAARAPPDSASVPETSAMSPLQIKSMCVGVGVGCGVWGVGCGCGCVAPVYRL
jgi:hypothetical protein